MNVPAGTQSGARLTVPGRGVPKLRANGRGDLGITFAVATPTKLDHEQRELLRQLATTRGEESPEATVARQGKGEGFFGWLKEAFS